MKRIFIFAAAAAALLTGCAGQGPKVPKTTFRAVTEIETSAAAEWTTPAPEPLPEIEDSESGGLEYVRSRLEDDLKTEYPNFKIVGARVPDSDGMPVTDIDVGLNPSYDVKSLAERFFAERFDTENEDLYVERFPDDPRDSSRPAGENNRTGIYIKCFQPDEEDLNMQALMHSTGLLCGSETGALDNLNAYSGNYETVATFDLLYETLPEDLSYEMSRGGEWNAGEAVAFMEEFWNGYVAPSDPEECSYRVRNFTVRDLGDGSFGYLFDMEKTDRNGNHIDMDPFETGDPEALMNGEAFAKGCGLTAWCAEKEKITRFSKEWSFSEREPEESGAKLLTLAKAGEILSQSLPPEGLGHDYTAELNYLPFCKGYPYNKDSDIYSVINSVLLGQCEYELRPFWCIRPVGYNSDDSYKFEKAYIDAITGEFTLKISGMHYTASEAKDQAVIDTLERAAAMKE